MSARRAAPRAIASSDVTRVRPAWIASVVAATFAAGALAFAAGARAPGPIARPHAVAKLACASCHRGEGAATSCAGCHAGHASARVLHRALAARGDLGCTTCHAGHGAEGVTFAEAGRFVRWGPGGERSGVAPVTAPAGVTVPFVPPGACARCHAIDDARDPAARCVKDGAVVCFDEHRAPADRYVAWEAAREVAATPPTARRASFAPWGWTGAAMGLGAIALAALSRRGRPASGGTPRGDSVTWRGGAMQPRESLPLERGDSVTSRDSVAPARRRLPLIDASTCLGCSACVDACPFDVLAIERFVAVVARPSACCGVVLCADACPNGSLRIAEGDAATDRPRLDAHLESLDAPGVFVAGDLSGLPLIRNAIEQGARVADRVASLPPVRGAELDLLVIGAGPAGLSAIIRAKQRGLRAACVEQSTFAASVRSFPRGKVVFDVPGLPPLEGPLWMREATKEELIAHWTRAVRAHALDLREHRRVIDVVRDDGGGFLVTALGDEGGREAIRAARVLLAIGRRGTPRTLPLAIAPGAEGKVSYALADARSFAASRVLVVGLGDTAMEAAIALAHAGAEVTMSPRATAFTRGKERNIAELRALAARERVAIVWGSRLVAVDPRTATLDVGGARRTIANDAVLVLIGGTPSWDLVTRAGVKLGGAGG